MNSLGANNREFDEALMFTRYFSTCVVAIIDTKFTTPKLSGFMRLNSRFFTDKYEE